MHQQINDELLSSFYPSACDFPVTTGRILPCDGGQRIDAVYVQRQPPVAELKPAPLPAELLPVELQEKSKAKFQEFKKKYPLMKDARLVRKVAEYFRIKLV